MRNNNILFSIIVPVYNTEKYIDKCIESILNQTYYKYEVIIINDGSTDNSKKVLEKYKDNEKIKIITQPNQGQSVSKNIGLKESNGDYILFVDSDDYIEPDLLSTLSSNIKDNIDIIRYQIRTVNEQYKVITNYKEEPFETLPNDSAIKKIVDYHFVETSCAYCFKRDLFIKNNLKFDLGFVHEDFGLIPLLLLYSKDIISIDYIGYNHIKRFDNILETKEPDKIAKQCNDYITLGIRNINIIKNSELKTKYILLSYIANSILIKGVYLDKKSRKIYYKQIKENKIEKYILTNTIFRKIKKLLLIINYNLYLKLVA